MFPLLYLRPVIGVLHRLTAEYGVLRRCVLQSCKDIGLFRFDKFHHPGIVHLSGARSHRFKAVALARGAYKVLQMDHSNVRPQQLDGLGEQLLPPVHIVQIQHVHRVEEHLQIVAADLVQHPAAAYRVIDAVPGHRLDGKGDAVLLRAAHHGLQPLNEQGQCLFIPALRAEFVRLVGRARLGAHHAAAQQGGKADVGVVLLIGIFQVGLAGIQKIQIIAQHGNIDTVFRKGLFQIDGVARRESGRGAGHVLHQLAQGQVGAGIALFPHHRQELFQGKLFSIVKPETELNHRDTSLNNGRWVEHTDIAVEAALIGQAVRIGRAGHGPSTATLSMSLVWITSAIHHPRSRSHTAIMQAVPC